ncbi:MAG TPA: radical SAM family heme chaperone HemW [Acidimicrobiales bacterium]|nr:radical SAM family heme chaperone HemW [Acidimicrobiales bacterium]
MPFCAARCGYCAFATWDDRGELIDAYLDALATEIRLAVDQGRLVEATSVFFGGGTPSLVPAARLTAVLALIPLARGAEVTVECNPDTVDDALMAAYRQGGVTRISMGVQSLDPAVLAGLGRTHTPANVAPAVRAVQRAGFGTFNLDLIYGVAGETLAAWQATLGGLLELGPPHVSAYALTVEPGTPLAGQPERHPDPDLQADMYLAAVDALGASGLDCYEISNFARPGHECRHNLLYWSQGDYLGLGAAAHSHRQGRRWWNLRTPERYIQAVTAGLPTEAAGEELDGPTRTTERLTLALRTREGVPSGALSDLPVLLDEGLIRLESSSGRAVLTPRGRLLANEVALRLR